MEDVNETNQKTETNTTEEITKSSQPTEQIKEDNQLQQEEVVKQQEQEKQIETPGEKPQQQQQQLQTQQQEPNVVKYAVDDDDDDEKETSQKLVIDIPEEEEEEKDEDDDDVIAIDDLPQELPNQKENEKVPPKPEGNDAIITLSDGEEDVITANQAVSKPGKIQKRRSVGSGSTKDEEHFPLKRRKINVAGAPKVPLTGYLRYMNDRRESVRKEHPSKTHMEHTKIIGEEWHSLPTDVKSSYLKAADVDKQRYVKELQSFLKSRPDILASELAKNKVRKTAENISPNPPAAPTLATTKAQAKDKSATNETSKMSKENTKDKMSKEIMAMPSTSQQAMDKCNNEKNKRKRTPTPPTSSTNATNAGSLSTAANSNATTSSIVTHTPTEIPIFTNEFLEHNKIYDMELRSLRKSKTDLEQQNFVLEKHVENMKFGVEKMITENNELEEKNRLLEIYLDKLKRKLALALSTLPLPSAPNGATVDNIDKYMQDLYKMSTSNSTGPATLNKAKDIIRKLDLQIQL